MAPRRAEEIVVSHNNAGLGNINCVNGSFGSKKEVAMKKIVLLMVWIVAVAFATACNSGLQDMQANVNTGGHTQLCVVMDKDGDGSEWVDPQCCTVNGGEMNCSLRFNDCDDQDPSVHPGAPEICDGKDNDCNGTAGYVGPMGDEVTDADGDGYVECLDPDDGDPSVHPCTDSLQCDDSNACTTNVCAGGFCTYTPISGCMACNTSADCNDGNVCTTESCVAGTCQFTNNTVECRPSAGACDVAEVCSAGMCPADAKSGAECRASAGVCDVAEVCDGIGNDCPTDAKSTAVCRASAGVCDVAESCDGVGNACPADAFLPSSTVCRPAAGVCDLVDNCSGTAAACPADAKSTAVCRPSAGVCDVAESCDGVANTCPADGFVVSGTPCPDGNLCNGGELCQGGVCTPGTPLTCDDGDECTTNSCIPATGCSYSSVAGCCYDDSDCVSSRPSNLPAGYLWGCTSNGSPVGACTSCADADGDGYCAMSELSCTNGWDDDGDGKVDMADPDCTSSPDAGMPDATSPDATTNPDAGSTDATGGCTSDSDCAVNEVCNPETKTCLNVVGRCAPFGIRVTTGVTTEWWGSGYRTTSTGATQWSSSSGYPATDGGVVDDGTVCSASLPPGSVYTSCTCFTHLGAFACRSLPTSPGVVGCVHNQSQ